MAADRPGAGQNYRVLSLADDPACCCDVGGVGVQIMDLLALQGDCIGRHFGDVLGQVDVGGAGFAVLGIFEGQTDNFAHRIRQDDLLGTLGDGCIHGRQVQVLVAGQLHFIGAHLARDGHQGSAVQVGVGHAGDQVGGAGA